MGEKMTESNTQEEDNKNDGKNEEKLSTCQRICVKMGINPNLIMLKITLFVMYGATSSLVPFLTIHMQSVGLTVEELAVIYLALPLTTFLAPLVTGFLVDKFGQFKPVLVISLIFNAVFHHALMVIPHMETPGSVPSAYVMRHPQNGKVEVWWSPCPSRECPERDELNLVVDKCEDHCLVRDHVRTDMQPVSSMIEQSIAVRPPTHVTSAMPPPNCVLPPVALSDQPAANTNATLNANHTANPDLYFIVQNTHKNSTGLHKNNSTKGKPPIVPKKPTKSFDLANMMTNLTTVNRFDDETILMVLTMHDNLMTPIENLGMELPEPDDSSEVTDFRQHFSPDMLEASGVNFSKLQDEDLRCGGRVVATNLTYKKLNELADDCMLQRCVFRVGGPEVCPPDYKPSDDRIFWLYFILRFFGTTMLSASVTVMDPIALTLINQHGGQYGRERLFSTLGMAIFSPLTGVLIDYKTAISGYTDFSYAFYMYDILLAISVVTVIGMPVSTKMPVDNIMSDMLKLLHLPHIIAFIFFMFGLGNFWGFIESYLFLHLKEIGASNYLLGITVSVATISSIPFLYGAQRITNKIGHVNVIVLAFFSHAIRLVGYSFIEEPWWVVPFEAMEAIAVHLMWVAAATYCTVIAPKNLLATLIGVLGMAHFSLGRGSGSFVGGFLIGTFGTRQSFSIMGFLCFLTGLLYSAIYFLWLREYNYRDDPNVADSPEAEKLNNDDAEKGFDKLKYLDEQVERLSLIIKLNNRGSLTSLDPQNMSGSRRNSVELNIPGAKTASSTSNEGSASKVDLLKSTLEINHLHKAAQHITSAPQLNRSKQDSNESNILDVNSLGRKISKSLVGSTSPLNEFYAGSGSIREEEGDEEIITSMVNGKIIKNDISGRKLKNNLKIEEDNKDNKDNV